MRCERLQPAQVMSGRRAVAKRPDSPSARVTPLSQNAGTTTLLQGGNRGRCRAPVKQALNLQTNTVWLSGAGQCVDVPLPAAERVQVKPVSDTSQC